MIKVNNEIISQDKFPDETPLLKFSYLLNTDENVITWLYDNMGELFNLYCIAKHLKTTAPQVPLRLVLPYVPNGRQDRQQDEKEDIFTLKYFCEIINSLEFSRVTIIDPHSTVTPALINNCHCVTNQKFFNIVKDKIDLDIVFYPDEGSRAKYSKFIKFPYAFGIKNRDWETGKIMDMDVIGDVKGKDILIVDDISSYGGTFLHSAKKLKKLGAKDICLLITHCEDSILKGELINSGLIKNIFTTNSIYRFGNEHKPIEVIYEF